MNLLTSTCQRPRNPTKKVLTNFLNKSEVFYNNFQFKAKEEALNTVVEAQPYQEPESEGETPCPPD